MNDCSEGILEMFFEDTLCDTVLSVSFAGNWKFQLGSSLVLRPSISS